jgi:hypothetical protein
MSLACGQTFVQPYAHRTAGNRTAPTQWGLCLRFACPILSGILPQLDHWLCGLNGLSVYWSPQQVGYKQGVGGLLYLSVGVF